MQKTRSPVLVAFATSALCVMGAATAKAQNEEPRARPAVGPEPSPPTEASLVDGGPPPIAAPPFAPAAAAPPAQAAGELAPDRRPEFAPSGSPVANPSPPNPDTEAEVDSTGAQKPVPSAPGDARPSANLSDGRFEFGSYGRISVASDLRGGVGRPVDVIAHGPRVGLDSYSEFELRREDTFANGIATRIVTTLGLFPPFFHFSGDPTQSIGLRNLYVQGSYHDLTLWAGSRMYRGDDIYLLNWWPLDNQNTVGGGAIYKFTPDTVVAVHAGMQRLDNPNQFQQVPNVAPYGFGSVRVTTLDRPRTIQTLKFTQFFRNSSKRKYFASEREGFKAIVYGEVHEISAGVRRDTDPDRQTALPADSGFLIGTQLAYWTGERDSYVTLFARYAHGLAAYDPLATPVTFANNQTTSGASETLFAVAGNWEKDWFGLLAAGYVRFFRDGGVTPTAYDKYDEGIIIARPQFYIGEHWGVGVEGSYQQRRYGALNAEGDGNLTASLLRGAVLPYFSPTGRGSFKRPQIGLVYGVTSRDSGARSLYAPDDVFSRRRVEHYCGILAEWWFNFSSYP